MTVLAGSPERLLRLRSMTSLLGPAFVTAIAYVDPGNVATNVAAGAQYGYLLLWVIFAANAMAAMMQYLSAKLGVVTGKSLAELLRDRLPSALRIGFWVQAEVVMMATDVAEVVGGAIALRILFGLPLLDGGLVTGFVSLLLPALHNRYGQRSFERVITGLLAVIAAGFMASLLVCTPHPGNLVAGMLPRLAGSQSVLLAVGILGATMMPHAVYLHSALVQDRYGPVDAPGQRQLLRMVRWDVGAAMLLAGTVNAAMLVVAATLHRGENAAPTLPEVPAALSRTTGHLIGLLFVVALLASGIAATSIGCFAGQVVMAGLLHRQIPPITRRLATLVPGLVVLAVGVDPTVALVLSQVVLSFGIPFAVIPLVLLTSRRSVMGAATNHRGTALTAGAITAVVITFNMLLIGLSL